MIVCEASRSEVLALNPKAVPLRAVPYLRLAQRIFRGPGQLEFVSSDREVLYPK